MSNPQIMSILASLTAIVSKESTMSATTVINSRKPCVCGLEPFVSKVDRAMQG